MNEALYKTLEILLIIVVGYWLQRKVQGPNTLKSLKTIILSIALPATIFLALLKIELQSSLLFLPAMALSFNLLMFGACYYLLPFFIGTSTPEVQRTNQLLLPSLAPGLSCFPFVLAYLGSDHIALAALADVGNKFFGLILLFLIAMYWHRLYASNTDQASSKYQRLKELMYSLISEPINVVIIIALICVSFGLKVTALPAILQSVIGKFSGLMVPLILLFIGLSMKLNKSDIYMIARLLLWRSGMAFFITGCLLYLLPGIEAASAILILVFAQSSCSFWPFAHMCTVGSMEEKQEREAYTFDQNHAIKVLAISLPFSSAIIITIFQFGTTMTTTALPIIIGICFLALILLPKLLDTRIIWFQKRKVKSINDM